MRAEYHEWESISQMFAALHAAECQYIVLRNYEELDDDHFYRSGHADIDFLVADSKSFAEVIKAYPRFEIDDGIHYKVNITGSEVVLDVRTIGDDYYDHRWEAEMLAKRYLRDQKFYVMDDLDYYYSLAYHAILQKKTLADDYCLRLNTMAADLGVHAFDETGHLAALETFMRKHGYYYTYPLDIWVPLRAECVDQCLVKKRMQVKIRDAKIKLLQTGSRVKHKILDR